MDNNSVKGFLILVYLAAASRGSTASTTPSTQSTIVTTMSTTGVMSPTTPTSSSSSPTVKSTSTAPAITPKTSISTTSVAATTPIRHGVNFTLSKTQFIEGGKGTIDLVCSIFNDFMPSFQEVIVSRDIKSGSTEFLAKLDLSGNTTMANSSNILQKMHVEGLIDDLMTPKYILLKLSLNESFLSCEDEATYRCHVSYTDAGSKPLYVETSTNLTGFFRPKEATLTAKRNGTSIPETTATNPAQVQIGDELELNCTAQIGSDTTAKLDMESAESSTALIPVTGLNQSSATKVDRCQYSSTGILKHIVSETDPGNMTFACEATANTPDSYHIISTNKPQLFIEKYVMCPRPTLDHGSIILSGTSINSTALLTCDPGYQALSSPSAICLSSGIWNMDLRCVPIACAFLGELNNGTVQYSDTKHAVGSNATFICNDDFFINGTSDPNITLTCTSGAIWSRPKPSCSSKDTGLSLEFSKNPFVPKSTENVTIACSVNWQELDNMVNTTYELLIRRQKHTLNIWEQLGKLDNTGHVIYINDSLIFHTMELKGFSTVSIIYLSLTVNETYLHCEDATLYECYLSYSDIHANRRYAAISKQLYSANFQSSASLTARRNGSVLPDTNSTHPAPIRVGDVLELNCTAEVGSDRSARILWESTTSVSLDTLIVYPPDPLTKSDVDSFENCQSVRSETIQHVITASDPANMTFACKALFMSANGTTTTNNPRFYLDIYSVCPRPSTPEHGFISLGGTTVNSRAEYSCDNGLSPSSGFGVCLPTGNWDTGFSCKAIECPYLQNPDNGLVNLDDGSRNVNDTATYSCYPGYTLSSNPTIVCTEHGIWSSGMPECTVNNCTEPSPPPYGFYNISEGLTVNSTARLECVYGSSLMGNETITCLDNNTWTNSSASCIVNECPVPVNPDNGYFKLNNESKRVNDTITFYCYPGYSTIGLNTTVCGGSGHWMDEEPKCLLQNCTEPSPPPYGTYNMSEALSVNSTALLVCANGSSLLGNGTITCLDSKTWTNSSGHCVVNECQVPASPDNGYFELNTGSRNVNDTVTYYCHPGYSIKGPNTTICNGSGNWTGETPRCLLKNCTEPTSPANGKIIITDELSVNSSVKISCNRGYWLFGSPYITCLENASWSSNTFACTPADCTKPVAPANGIISESEGLAVNSTATISCRPGYNLTGQSTIYCQENTSWSYSQASCVLIECPYLQNPDNGLVNLDDGSRNVNDTATYSCYPGYTLSSKPTIVCTEHGIWSSGTPECTVNNCTEPSPPPYGFYNISEGLTVNSTARLECVYGASLMGNETITCLDNNTWTNSSASCIVNECPVPVNPDNGYFKLTTGSRRVNDTITYYCYPGYSTIGHNTSMCGGRGNWIAEAPKCLLQNCTEPSPPSYGTYNMSEGLSVNSTALLVCANGSLLLGNGTITCLDSKTWTNSSGHCVVNECQVPASPDNGYFKLVNGSRNVNDSVTYYCRPGYSIKGPKTTICNGSGNWTGETPICLLKNCTEPTSPTNGNINITEGLSVNSSVTISCNNGYLLSGYTLVTCMENASWSSNNFSCNAVDCGPWNSKTVVSHSKVNYHPDTKFRSVATATCNEGYRLINSTNNTIAVCGENGTWSKDSPPICQAVVCPRFNVSESVDVILPSSEPLPVNATATFQCKSNATRIIGARVIRCQSSGEWTDKPPTCLKIEKGVSHCPRESDSHDTTWNETEPGTNVIKDCQTNYTGHISRQCTVEGKWLLPIYDCVTQELKSVEQDIEAVLDHPEQAEAVVDNALDKLKDITSKPEGTQIFSGEIEKVTSVLENIANISEKMNVTDTQTKDFLDTTSNLLDSKNTNAWKSVEQKDSATAEDQDDKGAEKILTVISKYSEAVAKTLMNSKEPSKTVAAENLVLHVSKITNATKDIVFPDSEAARINNITGSFRLPYQAIKELTNYSSVVYKNLSGILSSHSVANGKNGTKTEIRSSVISVKIDNWQKNRDKFSIQLTLEHFKGSKGEPHCSFWNDTESGWDGTGCTLDASNSNESVTACNCTHLTNFAILMSPIQDNVKNKAIDIITITACSISLIALVLTVAVHAMLWRYLKSDRVVILVNLSVALIISYLIFLIGVDRTENKAACTAVAVLLQYIYLVVFFLMLAEGIEIGVSVLYVFVTKSRLKWLLPSAWLIPAVIVGISLGATQLKGYGNDQFCWLSVQGGLIWAFIGPACFIIVVNFVLLVLVIKTMFKAKTLADKSRAERTKAGVRCLCILLPLMGCTWLIGIFYVNKSMAWIQYVFAVCNGLQGLVIFICHCAMNKQIRMAIQRRKKKYFDSLMSSRSSSKPFSLPRASTASTSQFEISNSFSGDYESKTSQGRINSRSNRNSFEMMPTSNRDSSEMNASLKRRL